MAIEMVKIRASVALGNILAVTPSGNMASDNIIMSFNVDRNRGQISTFSASLKVKAGAVSGNILGSEVVIKAGRNSDSNLLFTGIARSANITPCRDDPIFIILNVSGNDVLSRLEGKKYTRRCRSTRGTWVSINNVTRPGLRTGKLAYTDMDPTIEPMGGDVNRKDNVKRTVATNAPNVDRITDESKTAPVSFEISHQESH
jgi:hypothetical protein